VPGPPLLLVPPSEGKAAGGHPPTRPDSFAGVLEEHRAAIRVELARVIRSGPNAVRAEVLGVRGELLERALAATNSVVEGTALVLPAWRRYSGVVWAGLDPVTLSLADRRRIIVPSGLYGMTTAADPVADYRLKLLVSLGRLGRLSTFWRSAATAALATRARGRVVFDLLPAEHGHALDLHRLDPSTRVVRFRFVSADGRRAVGHDAKSAKGRLARTLVDGGIDAVRGFAFAGWRAEVDDDLVTVVAPTR